jgi:predicted RNA-binding protein with PUA-like domain
MAPKPHTGKPAAHPHDSPWAAAFARRPGETKYWLVKSEPTTFSFDDLMRAPRKTTGWDGVRNPVARNFLRDGMKTGDQVFFYHSSTKPQAIVGICEVVKDGYPEPEATTWFMVELRAVAPLPTPVTLSTMRAKKELAGMPLLRLSRLSVSPVTRQEWDTIRKMGSGA